MLKLTKVGNALKVEGQNHPLFPNDGYLMLPLNSVIVVTDESDIVTFRSSSTNDVLFSGLISDITIQGQSVTKENVCETFGSAFNVASGEEGGLTPEQEQRLNNSVQISDYNADKEAQATIDESQNAAIEGKQDKINDLDTIREGAGKGATALQEETDPVWNADKGNYYTKSETDGLVNEAKASANSAISIASSAEGIANDAHSRADEALNELNNKANKSEIPSLDGYATESWVEGKGYLTEHQDISGKQDVITDLAEIRDGAALGKTALQSFTEVDPTVPAHVKAITEEDIAKWNQGGDETDPIWTAEKVNYSTTEEMNIELNKKQDKLTNTATMEVTYEDGSTETITLYKA